uniref:hemolysin family protein n=1 Tax=Flavobacterium sp. TaxID=239 RepID=UPI00404AADE3
MEVWIIIICLLLSAFFSGVEIAFISSNKVYLGIEKLQDNFYGVILSKLTQKPSRFIAAMLVGNNVALVVYGINFGKLIVKYLNEQNYQFSELSAVLIQTVISTIIILITAEFLPKVFFQIYANSILKVVALPAYIFYLIFYVFATAIIWMSDIILRVFFKTQGDQEQLLFSKVELGNYISEQMSAVDENRQVDSEIQIFQNALEFSGVKSRDIMIPRTEITSVEMHESIENLKNTFVKTGYSKILIHQNSLDDVIGYVHSFELFKRPKTLKSIAIQVEFVPETMLIKDVLSMLTKKRKSVALVLDEYGGTSGMITVEDIIEELFGEIEDEHDFDESLIEEQIDESTYIFSARLDVEYLNEKFRLDIPESDSYTTLGGFIVYHTTEIPMKGDDFNIEDFHFTIQEATGNKIELVKLTVLEN